jgi:ketosteroid isomerase-like protein
MLKTVVILSVAAFAAGPVAASDKTDVMAVVHQWVDGFNKGDTKSELAACADEGAIIDDIPPHEWHGSGMCSKWQSDFDAWAATNRVTAARATPGKARHVDVDGSTAYVVLPITLTYMDHDKPMKESGSLVTMSLSKGGAGWRITAWSWAAGMTAAASANSAH